MSLARDFYNYYGNCFVGYKGSEDSPTLPFFVTQVRDDRRYLYSYGEEARNSLIFSGQVLDFEGGSRDVTEILGSGKIVLEMPELGYVSLGDQPYWVTFRPQRSMRKGLCSRRIEGLPENLFGTRFAVEVYKKAFENPSPISRQFFLKGDTLLYKGRPVGRVADGKCSLNQLFKYLKVHVTSCLGLDVDVKED